MILEHYGCPIVEVRSVGAFIEAIENNPEIDGYSCFRGESKDYGNSRLTATALRNIGVKEEANYSIITSEILSYNGIETGNIHYDYYKQTYSRLSVNEKENFLAFCQHHGIPTNLLDITTNPLIALYFSCNDSKNETGLVYTFFNVKVIDFSKIVSFRINDILSCDTNIWRIVSIDAIGSLLSDEMDDLLAEELVKRNINQEKVEELKILSKMLVGEKVKKSIAKINIENVLDYIKNIYIYSPLITFDRAISQQSKFIFQFHSYTKKQIIKPNYIIKIPANSKYEILKNLDRLNINQATIFQDFDNIAQYIKEKHGYK